MLTLSVTSTGDLLIKNIKVSTESSIYIAPFVTFNENLSVNYDFEEPEFDNITNEAKVSSLS